MNELHNKFIAILYPLIKRLNIRETYNEYDKDGKIMFEYMLPRYVKSLMIVANNWLTENNLDKYFNVINTDHQIIIKIKDEYYNEKDLDNLMTYAYMKRN